ncbi:MAG: methyltransferase domain-containing protein [Pyrinomonadaceae bacterium]|nr:methyltransferase domain-containing protein [Pyrinomonadaceae bacterium]
MSGTPDKTLPPDYFNSVYAANADPWSFETSEYEGAKYTATLSALPRERYRNAFEIGCSIGVLTERLAARCDQLTSVDVSEKALARARSRCALLPHVNFRRMEVPREYPAESFDLTLLSEVGYYFSISDLHLTRGLIIEHLASGGHLLLVHWTSFVHDYPLTGDEVHDAFLEISESNIESRDSSSLTSETALRHLVHRRTEHYRLDLFERLS